MSQSCHVPYRVALKRLSFLTIPIPSCEEKWGPEWAIFLIIHIGPGRYCLFSPTHNRSECLTIFLSHNSVSFLSWVITKSQKRIILLYFVFTTAI
jgi:hypothetical protein